MRKKKEEAKVPKIQPKQEYQGTQLKKRD